MSKLNNCSNEKAIMLGAAYYPEDWDESEQAHDIEYMKKAGLNVVRIAEFAWSEIEPTDGNFKFDWLHRVIDRLGEAGIRVIIGTPTATPPIWLEEKEPAMYKVLDSGVHTIHGGRKHCCSNSVGMRKYGRRVVEALAKEFGSDSRVAGWQVDNEECVIGKGCFCDECRRRFTEHLKNKYGTIENLNKRWVTNIFSQRYERFDQIPAPERSWQQPHILYEWFDFQANSYIEFLSEQADIIHKYSKAPVGTDMMPIFTLNYEKATEVMDVVQFNHYNSESDVFRPIFWYDYFRNLKDRPFWCTETSTCWSGSVATAFATLPIRGLCRVNSWLPIIHGGEANLYWLWRQHQAGHELMHGSLLYASGRPLHTFNEVQEISEQFKKASDFIVNTKVETDIAMQVMGENHLIMGLQNVYPEPYSSWNPSDVKEFYKMRLYGIHEKIMNNKVRVDVIGTKKPLDKYKLLITPFAMTMEIGDIQQRVEKWVRDGGTWIAGPLTDVRNDIGAHYTDRETGMLECLTGSELVYQVPDSEHKVECTWNDGTLLGRSQWLQLFDIPEDAEELVSVTGDFYAELMGKSVIFRKQVGKGNIIVLGAIPTDEDMKKLMSYALKLSGAKSFDYEGKLTVAHRVGEGIEGYALAEYRGGEGLFRFDGKMTDILTGNEYENEAKVAPYQVMILKK